MPLAIEPCEDTDIDRVFYIISDAFRHAQPYVDAVFPNHNASTVHVQGRDRLLELKHTDPTIRLIKAVDTTTRQIIGQANWSISEKAPADEQLERVFWKEEDKKHYAQQLFAQLLIPGARAIDSQKDQSLGSHLYA